MISFFARLTGVALPGEHQPRTELEACRSSGMNDTLTKPVQLASLRAMLERFPPATR